MDYQTFPPDKDLREFVKCFWTLKVPKGPNPQRQRIVPDGCIEIIFTLGDDVKRFVSKRKYIIQPRSMVLGQITEPFYIEPIGIVDVFAIRFFPGGFIPFTTLSIKDLENKETKLEAVFEKNVATDLERKITHAANTEERIQHAQAFLLNQLRDSEIIDNILKSTVDLIFSSKGRISIHELLKNDPSKRRQLERKFSKSVGLGPKQLARIIRFQTALKMLLNNEIENLTNLAYENEYYDQAHFIKDFREFTGINPNKFFKDKELNLSTELYAKD